MSIGKETIQEDTKSEAPSEICHRKLPNALGKRKIPNAPLSPTKQVKIPEKQEKDEQQCAFCSKKLKFFNTFTCRCEKMFCSRHRFYDQHQCSFDFKKEAQKRLKEANPKITPKKIGE